MFHPTNVYAHPDGGVAFVKVFDSGLVVSCWPHRRKGGGLADLEWFDRACNNPSDIPKFIEFSPDNINRIHKGTRTIWQPSPPDNLVDIGSVADGVATLHFCRMNPSHRAYFGLPRIPSVQSRPVSAAAVG